MTYQRNIGNIGEEIAADYLRNQGYKVLDRNFTVRYGELDLVAMEAESIVFVEVKTRTSAAFGLPESSITSEKLERVQNAGLMWLQENPSAPDDWRIDVIAILIGKNEDVLDIQHFINVHV